MDKEVVTEAYVLDKISYLLQGGRVVCWFKGVIYGVRPLGFKLFLCTFLANYTTARCLGFPT